MAKHTRRVCMQVKTRYFEKFKINISTCRIQTKLKALEYKEYFAHIDSVQILKSLKGIQVFFSIWFV
jgi:hypothetical protein